MEGLLILNSTALCCSCVSDRRCPQWLLGIALRFVSIFLPSLPIPHCHWCEVADKLSQEVFFQAEKSQLSWSPSYHRSDLFLPRGGTCHFSLNFVRFPPLHPPVCWNPSEMFSRITCFIPFLWIEVGTGWLLIVLLALLKVAFCFLMVPEKLCQLLWPFIDWGHPQNGIDHFSQRFLGRSN